MPHCAAIGFFVSFTICSQYIRHSTSSASLYVTTKSRHFEKLDSFAKTQEHKSNVSTIHLAQSLKIPIKGIFVHSLIYDYSFYKV